MKKLYPLAFALMAGSVYAEPQFYVAASAGMTSQSTEGESYKDEDPSVGIAFGVNISENAALEVAYRDFGEAEESDGVTTIVADVAAINVGVKAFVPTSAGFNFVGHMGFGQGDFTYTTKETGFANEDETDAALGYYIGLGVELEFSENFYAELGYSINKYDVTLSGGGESIDVSHEIKEVTGALGYRF